MLTYAMFPQVAAKFFATRDEGPQEPGQGSGEDHAGRRGLADGAGAAARPSWPNRSPMSSRYNGKAHCVKVSPAQ